MYEAFRKNSVRVQEQLRGLWQAGERRHKDTNSSGWERREREKSASAAITAPNPGRGAGKWSQVIVMCDNYYYCTPAPPH